MLAAPREIVGKYKNLYVLMPRQKPLQTGLVVFEAKLFVDPCGRRIVDVIAAADMEGDARAILESLRDQLPWVEISAPD